MAFVTKHRKLPWLAALVLPLAAPFMSIAAASAAPMTPPPLAPSFSHLEIGADGAWVVGDFPAGSGRFSIGTYNPTDFDHQLLTDSVEVDASVVAVHIDKVLKVFSPTCAQLDVGKKGEEQPIGGALETSGCQETPPPTTAPPVTAPPTTAPPASPPPAPASPPVAPPGADSPPDAAPVSDAVVSPVTAVPVAAAAESPTAAAGTLPLTGRNTNAVTTLGLTLLSGGLLLTVPRTLRRRWSRAR